MSKHLCDLKSWLKKDLKEFVKLVRDPTHICEKCGRVANEKKMLCEPVKLKD